MQSLKKFFQTASCQTRSNYDFSINKTQIKLTVNFSYLLFILSISVNSSKCILRQTLPYMRFYQNIMRRFEFSLLSLITWIVFFLYIGTTTSGVVLNCSKTAEFLTKTHCITIVLQMLADIADGSDLLKHIIASEETWVYG